MLWKHRLAANSLMTIDVHSVFIMDRSWLFLGKLQQLLTKLLIVCILKKFKCVLTRTDETLNVL